MSHPLNRRKDAILFLLGCLIVPLHAAAADIATFSKQRDEWFRSADGRQILDNVLTWQNKNGGWWKAYDPTKPRSDAKTPQRDERFPAQDQNLTGDIGTFDNKATWSELRLLARAYSLTNEQKYRDAFDAG